MKKTTCCFIGHRKLPADTLPAIRQHTDFIIDRLVSQGITHFLSGGALGFDQMAAELVIAKRAAGAPLKLTFALTCPDQDKHWSPIQQLQFRGLLEQADHFFYLADTFFEGYLKCGAYLVYHSAYCICYLTKKRSGTAQTVNMAKENKLTIINIAKPNLYFD